MTRASASAPGAREIPLDEYYASQAVRAKILAQCGGSDTTRPTAAFIAVLGNDPAAAPTWEQATAVPVDQVASLWTKRSDLARSLWDSSNLIFALEIDYENLDRPTEPFLHPADMFVKLEPTYQAASAVFHGLRLPVQRTMSGRGYHFLGRIPLNDPIVAELATLVPATPRWYATVESRRVPGVTTAMPESQARAAEGVGCLLEHAAHLIRRRAAMTSPVPVVFNGTTVGNAGPVGRECVSIDFSHVGDPLDVRHLRLAFSTYQWHHLRPDIFGESLARTTPVLAVMPRTSESPATLLTSGRGLGEAMRAARQGTGALPNLARGVGRLLAKYRTSPLSRFHASFYAALEKDAAPPERPNIDAWPPCVAAAWLHPNDLLLKPQYIQHLVRWLMSRGWAPATIARLVQRGYETDHGWGDRWTMHMDAATRAAFDVRVFAGMIEAGADRLVDFNCVSAQEKDLCPQIACPRDLRTDRARLELRVV